MADPLYRQIAEDLRRRIESGQLPPGSQLPTELQLREEYGNASRNTIRDAIGWLSNQGLVLARPGRGTYVKEKITPFIVPMTPQGFGGESSKAFTDAVQAQHGTPHVGDPRVEVRNAPKDLARELELEKGAQVVSRHQERFIDDGPSSLQTSFYPMEFVQNGAVDLLRASDMPDGATQYIEDTLGIKAIAHRDRLTVRRPDSSETAFFRLQGTGTVQVAVVRRTAYTNSGRPIRFTVTVYPADRVHFVIDSGEAKSMPPLHEIVREL